MPHLQHVRCLPALLGLSLVVAAQDAGVRGGATSMPAVQARSLEPKDPARRIEIEGCVEIRVDADAIRVVLAVCSDGADPATVSTANQQRVQRLRAAFTQAQVPDGNVHIDFIAMLPVYDWEEVEEAGRKVARERLSGWRLQENVHVAVGTQEQLDTIKRLAREVGVFDVLAVDYASSDVEKHRTRALEAALAVAKAKAAILLAQFGTPQKLVNVTERTVTVPPHAQYRSFESANTARMERHFRDETPRVFAVRPKNTLYEGYTADVDRPGGTLPMRPQICVVSSVKLYYESPEKVEAAGEAKK